MIKAEYAIVRVLFIDISIAFLFPVIRFHLCVVHDTPPSIDGKLLSSRFKQVTLTSSSLIM